MEKRSGSDGMLRSTLQSLNWAILTVASRRYRFGFSIEVLRSEFMHTMHSKEFLLQVIKLGIEV
jgi:hypothetical protein